MPKQEISYIEQKNGIESFIQTDAAINPGNSSALVNTNGDLVGIIAIQSNTGSYTGYGFAIPPIWLKSSL